MEERGWIDAGTFIDVAKTGSDPGRDGFNELLDALRERPVRAHVVLVWAYRRLAREEGLSFELLSCTYRAGVPLFSISDPVPHGFRAVMEPLVLWQAAEESRRQSADTKRGMADMIRRGFAPGGFPPRGYKVTYEVVSTRRDGVPRRWPRWVKDPEIEEAVTQAWQMRLGGASYQSILAETSLYSARGSLVTFFQNPAYCGYPSWYLNHYNLNVVDCVDQDPIVAAYVSVPEWLRVQEMSPDHPRRQYGNWPLSGMIFCGYCGSACASESEYRKRYCERCRTRWTQWHDVCKECGADYSYRGGVHRYLCGAHHARADRCPGSRRVGGTFLEEALLLAIGNKFDESRFTVLVDGINEALQAAYQGMAADRRKIERQLHRSIEILDRILAAIEKVGPSEALLSRLQARELEAANLRARLAMMPAPEATPFIRPERVQYVADLLRERAPEMRRADQRQLFKTLGVRVELYREEARARFEWPPLKLLLPLQSRQDYVGPHRQYPQGGLSL